MFLVFCLSKYLLDVVGSGSRGARDEARLVALH